MPSPGTGKQESVDTGQPRVGDQPSDATTAVERRNLKLYHERFGHVNLPTVRRTLKVVDGVQPQVDSVTTSRLCDACTNCQITAFAFLQIAPCEINCSW